MLSREEDPLLIAVSFSKLLEKFKHIIKDNYNIESVDTELKCVKISSTNNKNKDILGVIKRLEYGEHYENIHLIRER